jgi:hypothetical protein
MDETACQIVTFSEGKGQIAVPDGYEVSFGEGGMLQLLELTARELCVYATFHDYNLPDGPASVGETLVLTRAQQKGLQLMPMGDRVAIVEPGQLTVLDGQVAVNVHWQIGFGNHLVVLSASFPRQSGESQQVRAFLGAHWEPMVRSLKSARAAN